MKNVTQPVLQLTAIIKSSGTTCFWCGRGLRNCGTCKGSGIFKGSNCRSCNGLGRLCNTHEADWEE